MQTAFQSGPRQHRRQVLSWEKEGNRINAVLAKQEFEHPAGTSLRQLALPLRGPAAMARLSTPVLLGGQ